MTLHIAIEDVLLAAGRPLTASEIAAEVNRRGAYRRADGTPVPGSQVSARVRKYPGLFVKTAQGIWVADRGRTEPSVTTAPVGQRLVEPPSTSSTQLADDSGAGLLSAYRFRSAGLVDADVPDAFGLYAIRVRDIGALPEPFRSIAERRGSTLIYVGEATGQTLRRRFLRNELRGRGHGTFFRSIGAVLGYRPGRGSLIGKENQRNYRFSESDTAAIVEWINGNLEVSWVALDGGIHAHEVELIRVHTPLLNLRDNPRALPELAALRAECCAIATTP